MPLTGVNPSLEGTVQENVRMSLMKGMQSPLNLVGLYNLKLICVCTNLAERRALCLVSRAPAHSLEESICIGPSCLTLA